MHVESKGAWDYQLQKWNGSSWVVILNTALVSTNPSGVLPNEVTDTVTQGQTQDYAAWAGNPGTGEWSALAQITVPTWTTDLWNASFENAYQGNGAWFWASNNGPTTQLASGFDGESSPEFTPPAGNWASIFQERPIPGNFTVCPRVVARRPRGTAQTTRPSGCGSLPSGVEHDMTYSIPDDGAWR